MPDQERQSATSSRLLVDSMNALTAEEIDQWREALERVQLDGTVLPPGSNVLCYMAKAALSEKPGNVCGGQTTEAPASPSVAPADSEFGSAVGPAASAQFPRAPTREMCVAGALEMNKGTQADGGINGIGHMPAIWQAMYDAFTGGKA